MKSAQESMQRVLLVTPYPDHFRFFLEPNLIDALSSIGKDFYSLVWPRYKNPYYTIKNYIRLIKTINRFKPDTLLVFNALDIDSKIIKYINFKNTFRAIYWFIDSPINMHGEYLDFKRFSKFDYYFQATVWPEHLQSLVKLGYKNVNGLQLAANTPCNTPISAKDLETYGSDVTSVGVYYTRGGRAKIWEKVYDQSLNSGYSCKFWGPSELPVAEGFPFVARGHRF